MNDYNVIKQIGKGSFSNVHLCRRKKNNSSLLMLSGIYDDDKDEDEEDLFIIKEINLDSLVKKYVKKSRIEMRNMKHLMKNLDIMYFEANYCEDTIRGIEHKYHDTYLHRLMSDYGHLGMHQTIDALVECSHNMQKIILSHISENTNSYENAYRKVRDALIEVEKFPEILVGFQGEPTEWIE